jgi:DNA-damage-inducible protein D
MSDLIVTNDFNSPFDSLRHVGGDGNEFWYARELMPLMGYDRWQNFVRSVQEAIENLELNGDKVSDHFLLIAVKSRGRDSKDYKLSRYACYMSALCCDGRKIEVASAKKYFAVKTREAELREIQPKTALELARENVKLAEQNVAILERMALLEAEKAILESENEKLAEAVDELFEYSSIIRVAKFNDVSETSFNWRLLKAASNKLGLEIKRVPSPRYEYQNLYSHDAWRLAYPEYRLPETTTLVIAREL